MKLRLKSKFFITNSFLTLAMISAKNYTSLIVKVYPKHNLVSFLNFEQIWLTYLFIRLTLNVYFHAG